MNPLLLSGIFDIGKSLIDRFFPDPEKKAAAQLDLLKMQQSGELAQLAAETDLAKLQIQVNVEEAKSESLFVAGWRPFVGWICGAALGCNMILRPLLAWSSALVGHAVDLPSLDMTTLSTLLMAMLGLGVLRTVEKVQGAEDKR